MFIAIDKTGRETPPMDIEGLKYLCTIDRLNDASLVRPANGNSWVSLGSLLTGGAPVPPPRINPPSPAVAPPQAKPKAVGIPDGYEYASEPWSRIWAYWADSVFLGFFGSIGIGLVLGASGAITTTNEGEIKLLDFAIGMLAAWTVVPFGIALSQCFFGSTPGKALFGIRVWEQDGSKPTFPETLARNYKVLVNGLYLGIPIVYLFGVNQFLKNLKSGVQPVWDTENSRAFQYRPEKRRVWIMWIVAVFGLIVLAISKAIVGALAQMR